MSWKVERLNKIPAGYENRFYRDCGNPFNKDVHPSEDVKNYLVWRSDFGKGMWDDINMYVTHDRHNNASFIQKLDSIPKNIFRRKNPVELVFKDI